MPATHSGVVVLKTIVH